MEKSRTIRKRLTIGAASSILAILTGCSAMGSSGPSTSAIKSAGKPTATRAPIAIVELDGATAARLSASRSADMFSQAIGDGVPAGTLIGRGDVLDISVWEAPPAVLLGTLSGDVRLASAAAVGRGSTMPEQMVDQKGNINVPFAGEIRAQGRTLVEIEQEIVNRLAGKAHEPQADVRLVRNATSRVTVVGDVATSALVPLTPKGERLLEVLSTVGGVKQPVGKTVIQITRGSRMASMPLETVINDPRQNIRLQADDVVTALYQPYSFTALGATNLNAQVNFEATGLTLAEALGRVGGLRDERANARGVFLFRMENPEALSPAIREHSTAALDGRIPVIYQLNLRNPASFFVAQNVQVRNKDVIYVSNAPVADLQKFVGLVSQMAFSLISIGNAVN